MTTRAVLAMAVSTSMIFVTQWPAPERAHAQTPGAEMLTPPPPNATSNATSESDRNPLPEPARASEGDRLPQVDLYAADPVLRRDRRFRRAGAVLSVIGTLIGVAGAIAVASWTDSCVDSTGFCIDVGPLGGYFLIGVGGVVLLHGLAFWGIGTALERHRLFTLTASLNPAGGRLRFNLRF